MNQLKIATRLKLLGLLVISVVILLAGLGYSIVGNMTAVADSMYTRGLVSSKVLSDANNAVWELRFGIANYTLASPENRKKILEGRPALYDALEEGLKKYAANRQSPDQAKLVEELLEEFQAYKAGVPKWFELIDAEKMGEAAEYRAKTIYATAGAMVKNIKLLIEGQLRANEELQKHAEAAAERSRVLLVAISSSALLLVGISVWVTSNAISRTLLNFQSDIESIEKNSDFTRRITISGDNEITQTGASFNKLMDTCQASLRELIGRVEEVSRAATKLSASSDRVASGSTQQSSAASSMAATVEEVNVSINHVTDNAKSAMEFAISSGELSDRGGEVIQKAVSEILDIAQTIRDTSSVIEKLGEQSGQISSVVDVIKEVAEQTNLLALNAAIEAARAGEQGRGFAVVADEVRKLAERTTKSTHEVSEMIRTIQTSSQAAVASMSAAVHKMDGGVDLANQAGKSIDEIRERANDVATIVKEISSALQEQRTASNDLAKHVETVAQMAEANSVAADEIAQATHSLEGLTEAMRSVGRKFKT